MAFQDIFRIQDFFKEFRVLAPLRETGERICMKFSEQVGYETRDNWNTFLEFSIAFSIFWVLAC